MSKDKSYNKSIFFLILLYSIICSHILFAQSSDTSNQHFEESSHIIGEILFVANLNGVIENCNCGKAPLGGLPQITSVINRQKSENTYTYYIDGGDFFNTYPYALLNTTILDIYRTVNLTYLALGDQEWIDTDKLDNKVITDLSDKIIASNYTIENAKLNKCGKINFKDGTSGRIISYLDEKAFYNSEDKKNINFNQNQFISIYDKISADKDLIILLFHGTAYTLKWIKQQFPKIDLILFAHEQSDLSIISEKPAVVGGGADGEYIQQIFIYRESNEFLFKVNSIPVSLDLAANPETMKIIRDFKIADKAEKEN